MANVFYDNAKKNLWNGTIDLDTNTIKCALVTSSYTPSQASHEFFSDITNEVTGTGYTAGGQALTTKVVSADTSNHRGKFTADNVSWTSSTITARGAVLYKDTGTASTSPLIGYIDFGSDKSSSSGTFTIQWDGTNGIAYF